jgi:hypothetical protein
LEIGGDELVQKENAEMSANEKQVGGDHYTRYGDLQHWDVVHHFGLDYFQGQITRYVFRWRHKGGIEDLRKAKHYIDKYIELALNDDRISAAPDLTHHLGVDGRTMHTGSKLHCPKCQEITHGISCEDYEEESEPQAQGYVNQDGPATIKTDLR